MCMINDVVGAFPVSREKQRTTEYSAVRLRLQAVYEKGKSVSLHVVGRIAVHSIRCSLKIVTRVAWSVCWSRATEMPFWGVQSLALKEVTVY